jgi:DNA-binding response OmpR family regulator
MKTKILIVEDDANIRAGLVEVLRGENFEPVVCERGDDALAAVKRERPALMILDVMLPGRSGYEVCRQVRESKIGLPILMLTAKGQEMDKVIGLDVGADDYVTKPFGLRELLARIHALLRRTQPVLAEDEPFQIGSASITPKTLSLNRGRAREELTVRELKLLQIFHAHPGEVLSRERLLSEVWGYEYYGTTRTLDQVIVQLRRKLGDHGDNPRVILTVHGVGYKLAGP